MREGQTKTREDTSCGITTNLGTCNDDERCDATATGARCIA
jgi:hypothetical protein